jgi:hypothetical protein
MIDERVSTGDHHEVDHLRSGCRQQGLCRHGADPDRPDQSLLAKVDEGRKSLTHPALEVISIGVVEIEHIDVIELQSLERLVEARSNARGRRVPDPFQVVRDVEALVVRPRRRSDVGSQQASNLGG